jgi:hypothetical protein
MEFYDEGITVPRIRSRRSSRRSYSPRRRIIGRPIRRPPIYFPRRRYIRPYPHIYTTGGIYHSHDYEHLTCAERHGYGTLAYYECCRLGYGAC